MFSSSIPASLHPPPALISDTFPCFPHRCHSFFFSEDSVALAKTLARETGGEATYISSDKSMIFEVGTQEPWQIPLYSTDALTSKHPTIWAAHTQ